MRFLIVSLVLLAACSGGSETDSLQLGGGTRTEDEYRTEIRAFLLGEPNFCPSIQGLNNREIADTILKANADNGVTPIQEADPKDEERAAAIIREECERIR